MTPDDQSTPLTELADVPLGFEPLAEFFTLDDALAHYREEQRKGVTVLLVVEEHWWSLWIPRNPRWMIP